MKFIRAYNTNRKIWVEDWHYDKVRYINWHDDGKRIYACINGKTVYMARYLKGITDPNYVVDHINHDHRNNLESNLRVCSHAENLQNRKPNRLKNRGAKLLGTSWNIQMGRWSAQIHVNGVKIHLGYFFTEEEAGRAYDVAARKYFGEFARCNFPCPPFLATGTSKD